MDITQLLAFTVKNSASDLHISAGLSPMVRVAGELRPIDVPTLSDKDAHDLLYTVMSDKQRKQFEQDHEIDFSFAPRRERGKPAVGEQREASVILEPKARELATEKEVTGTSVA